MAQDSVDATMEAVNDACHKRGGKYAEYSCKVVSWDDVQRGTAGGSLSCWGANITDTRLWAKDGMRLFTVRSGNWNEKLGKVSADNVAVLVGNHEPKESLTTVSLDKLLKDVRTYGGYAGVDVDSLADEQLDKEISIRFQTTFLPVDDMDKASIEFASEAYNYNTMSDKNPRNFLLLCTTQGTAIQQDGAGAKKLHHHRVDEDGVIHRHWLEAERTKHKVGGPQKETKEERDDAIARGKATAKLIGLESLCSRFNVLMTIQVPLQQKNEQEGRGTLFRGGQGWISCSASPPMPITYSCADSGSIDMRRYQTRRGGPARKKREVGKSNAARVSRGSEVDTWSGLSVHDMKRNPSEHITVTVVVYNTVAGGVPSEDDVIAAIDDLEELYKSCEWTGRLADDGASFMKSELTVKDMQDIAKKVTEQPHPDFKKPVCFPPPAPQK